MTDLGIRLTPFRKADLDLLVRFAIDPAFSAPFEWSGFRSPEALRRRWRQDGFLSKDPHYLAVVEGDDRAVGFVMWRSSTPGERSIGVWEVGVLLLAEQRGRGVGTAAQRLLAEHLFETTPAHRLCAFTEADNLAEQRSLEKSGFRREGVLRAAGFRGGQWRDVMAYARLRDDA